MINNYIINLCKKRLKLNFVFHLIFWHALSLLTGNNISKSMTLFKVEVKFYMSIYLFFFLLYSVHPAIVHIYIYSIKNEFKDWKETKRNENAMTMGLCTPPSVSSCVNFEWDSDSLLHSIRQKFSTPLYILRYSPHFRSHSHTHIYNIYIYIYFSLFYNGPSPLWGGPWNTYPVVDLKSNNFTTMCIKSEISTL